MERGLAVFGCAVIELQTRVREDYVKFYIHGSVHFMQKILLSLSETMIKLHLFKMHSVKPFQSLICPANACQSTLKKLIFFV